MKIITRYRCEICQRDYADVRRATLCENQVIQKVPPIGLVFGSTEDFYAGITFCIAKTEVEGHTVEVSLWACRDNGLGDTLGKNLCYGSGYYNDVDDLDANMREHPTFKRMMKYLKKAKVKPLMIRRKKVVPIK